MKGKEYVAVIVVIFSMLSFTLGYFVGKIGREKKADGLQHPTEAVADPQNQSSMPPVLPPVTEGNPDDPLAALGTSQGKSGAPAGENLQQIGQEPADTKIKETGKEPLSDKKAPPALDNKLKNETLYTVQMGALKSSREAENFRLKYEKKGYKTYVITSGNNRGEKIFKIRTGEFRQRKDADILSLKLKKNEGLNTFVTLKTDPELIRIPKL
ncbi:MAG: SPOR domain-containing protein [Nitrospirae bacterium]|nr:SPOR domain-containing protein [Nitrospirota bacterium]